jgi:cysteine desulfurase
VVYLDHNATTPLDRRVLARMRPFLEDVFGNAASSDHAFGWDATEAVEEARVEVAELVGVTSSEIVFTSGATESINLAFKGLATSRTHGEIHAFVSAVEHDAVLDVCRQLARVGGLQWKCVPVCAGGDIHADAWTECIGAAVRPLTSLMLANNETGTIYPVREIADVTHRRPGGVFFCDLTQAAGKIPIDLRSQAIDLAALSAHKMYGPKGIGALVIRSGEPALALEPLLAGSQEGGRRGGTLNVPAIVGFGEACRIARLEMDQESARTRALRDKLEREIVAQVPETWINGGHTRRIATTTNIAIAGIDSRVHIRDMATIAVSTRSACSTGAAEPSHVLKAIGHSDRDAYACVRFSIGRFTTDSEIDRAIETVVASVHKLRRSRYSAVR